MSNAKPRQSKTQISKKTAAGNRRRYASAGAQAAAQCSVEKRTEPAHTVPKAPANQLKFVHQSKSKDSKGETASLQDQSKGLNEAQRAARLWFANVSKQKIRGIREEWVNVVKKIKPELSNDAFFENENLPKNRFDDVVLLDKTRVRIKINPDKDDYIHASRVEISPELNYICAQAPLINTVPQFWLMCIQEEVKVILQLCQNVEDGKEKCVDYMPTSINWTDFGPVQVKILKAATSVPSTRKVSKTVVQCRFEDREWTAIHILYSGWPDHTVAESIATCREVRSLVHKLYDKKPIIVHCSAGIGRTGTFVAIEMVMNKLKNECNGSFSMPELMQTLREQRALAVQNDQQYTFIFRCVIDILIAEECLPQTPEVSTFIQSYDDLIIRKKKQQKTKAKVQPGNKKPSSEE